MGSDPVWGNQTDSFALCGPFDVVAEIKGGSTGWDVVRAYRDAVARTKGCKYECADAEKGVDDAHRRLLGRCCGE